MRKVLLVLLALSGVAGASEEASAGQRASLVPVLGQPSQVQTVQYYDDWRQRQFRQQRRFERREFRRENRQIPPHRGYGYGPPPGYRQFGYSGPYR